MHDGVAGIKSLSSSGLEGRRDIRAFAKMLFDIARRSAKKEKPVVELRAFQRGQHEKKKDTHVGFFDNLDALVREAERLSANERITGVYVTLNVIDPKKIADKITEINTVGKSRSATTDENIAYRIWMPVDLDALRPDKSDSNSTDEEHETAIKRAEEIREFLLSFGFPEPIICDSGNGAWLLLRLAATPNTDDVTKLIKKFLEFLAAIFNDDKVVVDTTVYNASRIAKLPGTMVRKASESTDDRPWRQSRLLKVGGRDFDSLTDEEIENLERMVQAVPLETIKGLIQEYSKTEPAHELRDTLDMAAGTTPIEGVDPEFDRRLLEAFGKLGCTIRKRKTWNGATLYEIVPCPFDPTETNGAAFVLVRWRHVIAFKCHHNSCKDRSLKDLRELMEKTDPELASTMDTQRERIGLDVGIMLEDVTEIEYGKNGEIKKIRFSPQKAAGAILKKLSLAIPAGGDEVHVFNGEIFRPDGERQIDRALCYAAGDLVTSDRLKETLRRIKNELLENPVTLNRNPYCAPLKNGVLDLSTGEFREYRAEDGFTFKYPVEYKPNASYLRALWHFCSTLQTPADVLGMIDTFAAMLVRVPFTIIVLLMGGGGNGKQGYEYMMYALLGENRISAVTFNEIRQSRFSLGELIDKDVWLVSEVKSAKDVMDVLKKVSAGDFIDSDIKFGGRRKGRPHILPVLDANEAFDLGENTRGVRRRLKKFDLIYNFGAGPDDRPRDANWNDSLVTPECLSGLIRLIRIRAPTVCDRRDIYMPKSEEMIAEEYARQKDSMRYFCDECLDTVETATLSDGDPIPKPAMVDEVYNDYLDYCKLFKVPSPASSRALGKYISKRYGEDGKSYVTREGDKSVRRYRRLWRVQSPKVAFANFCARYKSYNYVTNELQNPSDKIDMLLSEATKATNHVSIEETKELEREISMMFEFIRSRGSPREISFENYLIWRENGHENVAFVAEAEAYRFFGGSEATNVAGNVASTEKTDSLKPQNDRKNDEVQVLGQFVAFVACPNASGSDGDRGEKPLWRGQEAEEAALPEKEQNCSDPLRRSTTPTDHSAWISEHERRRGKTFSEAQRKILDWLHEHGSGTRSQIATDTGLHADAVSDILNRTLLTERLVERCKGPDGSFDHWRLTWRGPLGGQELRDAPHDAGARV